MRLQHAIRAAALLTLASAQTQYGENHVTVTRDSDAVAENFPPIDDIELLSPAFQSPNTIRPGFDNGTEGPTTQFELDYFVQSLASGNSDWMTYRSADFSSEEGRSFPYVFLSTSASNGTSASSSGKLRAWLQGGVHGNEPGGDQSMLALLGRMDANQTWAASLLENMDIMILFRYNPDGIEYFQRTLATNLDPNRDHIKLMRQQTRDIKDLFNSFNPHIAADMHEFGANYEYGPDENLVQGADALFSAAKNLNIHPDIRSLSEELFASQIGEDLEAAGFRWEPYATSGDAEDENVVRFDEAGSDARIGRNAMGLTQTVTFLFETRGIGLANQEFQRRTACGLTMAISLLQTAADNWEQVYNTISSSTEDFISSSEDIVITDYTETSERIWTMIDVNNGSLIQQPIQFASTTPTTANLTRSRPTAYLIPRAWSDLAARLETYGVEVERLEYAYHGPVQALNITSSVLEDEYYEGLVLAEVTAREVEKEVDLPPGSFWVSTAQKNAALAFVALEPEGIDSFVTYGLIALEEGDEYPIFRVME